MVINFENLPVAVSQLQERLARIEQLLLVMGKKNEDACDWLDIAQLCNYLPDKPTKATVYGWVQAGKIPYHKGSKKLRFQKQEIDQWLSGNLFQTAEQVAANAHSYIAYPKKGGGMNSLIDLQNQNLNYVKLAGKKTQLLNVKSINNYKQQYIINNYNELLTNNYKYLNNNNQFNNQYNTLINDVLNNYIPLTSDYADFTAVLAENTSANPVDNHAVLPLFFREPEMIKIPKKVSQTLRRYTPKELLRFVDPDFETAIELCLIFLAEFSSTYFKIITGDNPDGWITLNAELLRKQFSTDPQTYKHIRKALEHPLDNGPIIECDYKYCQKKKSYFYKLGKAYSCKGVEVYQLKTKKAITLQHSKQIRYSKKAKQNPICINLVEFYTHITLPTIRQIINEAKRLIKLGYRNKKGKKLTFLNKHPRTYFKDPNKRSFVEECIEIFNYLSDHGLMIPTPGNEKSGGRVVDSFTLMPSWIRNLIKVDGSAIMECDYSCLHPNIVMKLYGGSKEFLTHDYVGETLGIDIGTVKKEHLSFFNKKPVEMRASPLYNYYEKEEPAMLSNIIKEKYKKTHKETSKRLFKAEVEIMTDVIRELNNEGIYVGYIYDALFFHPKHAGRVKQVMDKVILMHGVKTTAKLSTKKKCQVSMEQVMQNNNRLCRAEQGRDFLEISDWQFCDIILKEIL